MILTALASPAAVMILADAAVSAASAGWLVSWKAGGALSLKLIVPSGIATAGLQG